VSTDRPAHAVEERKSRQAQVFSMSKLDPELDQCLREARDRNEQRYTPPAYGQPYRSPLFEFVRSAKAHPRLGRNDAVTAAQIVDGHLASWGQSEGGDPWAAQFPNSDDPRTEFIDTWDKIKWPRASLELALQSATIRPLKPLISYSSTYERFVSVAGHLQRSVDGPILLPCLKFASLLNCDPKSISRYRQLGVKSGILHYHRRGRKIQREADEFKFAMEKFNWETGNEIASDNLKVCLASNASNLSAMPNRCTDLQETERKKEKNDCHDSQESEDKKELHEPPPSERAVRTPKFALSPKPKIPTTAELEEELRKTAHHLRF